MEARVVIFAVAASAVAAGCAVGSSDIDTPPQRAITSDIDATHQTSPSVITRGQRERDEPYDAQPWQLDGQR
jgi:hypothetical protein